MVCVYMYVRIMGVCMTYGICLCVCVYINGVYKHYEYVLCDWWYVWFTVCVFVYTCKVSGCVRVVCSCMVYST